MSSNFRPMRVEVFPTGSLNLDLALGVGGIPRGRMAEIYGPPASGKTTLGLSLIAEAQRRGFSTLFVDVEHSLDPAYAKTCGVDLDDVLLAQPQTGIAALQIIKEMVASGNVDLVVMDSLAALSPRAEGPSPRRNLPPGRVSQILPTALRELSLACIRNSASLVFTNQLRTRLRSGYGPPETTPGGLSVKFHAAVRISLKTKKILRKNEEVIGSQIEALVTKNTLGRAFRSAILNLVYNIGISKNSELLRLGLREKIITQRGAQVWFGERNLGTGRRGAEKFFHENPVVARELEQVLRNKLLPRPPMSMRD
ncbi:MAG: Protein RecA [Chloroflexi bacterium]|nr:Protein RecA [Chloroflexota bacterium]